MSHDDPQGRRRAAPPLDAGGLERLALRYVERFATTRGRLAAYLSRKVRERGWEGDPADPVALAERLAGLGYIDDLAFGEARAGAMMRRGLGGRRVSGALRAAGLDENDLSTIDPTVVAGAEKAAFAFARRRRIGPFATVIPDRPAREKQIGAMIRAGHSFELARKITEMVPGQSLDPLD
jgi:regulatory protein